MCSPPPTWSIRRRSPPPRKRPGCAVRAQPPVRPGAAGADCDDRDVARSHARSGSKVGTSTPDADPSGDYAFEVFRKAEALKPGAKAALEARRCSSPAGRRARRRRRPQRLWLACGGRDGPTFFLPIAPPLQRRSRRTPHSRSLRCRTACRRCRLRNDGDEWRFVRRRNWPSSSCRRTDRSVLEKHGFAAPALPQ